MKLIVKALAVTLALLSPALSFAQSANGPLTRAQVQNEQARLEQVGYYRPSKQNYPDDIQSAEAKLATLTTVTKATDPAASAQNAR